MSITQTESMRRAEIEGLVRLKDIQYGADDIEEIRRVAIERFTKELDGKIANAQWYEGERLAVVFSIDIVRPNGNIRGGSGAQRNMPEYIEWRNAVYERDDYICQDCGAAGGKLNAHHIKEWSLHPELRFDVDNGITLCFDCHALKHPHISYFS